MSDTTGANTTVERLRARRRLAVLEEQAQVCAQSGAGQLEVSHRIRMENWEISTPWTAANYQAVGFHRLLLYGPLLAGPETDRAGGDLANENWTPCVKFIRTFFDLWLFLDVEISGAVTQLSPEGFLKPSEGVHAAWNHRSSRYRFIQDECLRYPSRESSALED